MTASLIRILTAAAVCVARVGSPRPPPQTSPPGRRGQAAQAEDLHAQSRSRPRRLAPSRRRTATTPRSRSSAAPRPSVAAPAPTPVIMTPAAAQAFAAYELARVRVVTAEEADGARQLADAAANATTSGQRRQRSGRQRRRGQRASTARRTRRSRFRSTRCPGISPDPAISPPPPSPRRKQNPGFSGC